MSGNPESVKHGDTCENSQVCLRALMWVALSGGCCSCSAAGNLTSGKALLFTQTCEQGLSRPHPQQLVQSLSKLCLTVLSRNLTAYGASPGLHSCMQEPTCTSSKWCCLLFMAGAASASRFAGKAFSCKDAPKAPRDLLSFRHVHLRIAELLI